MSPTIGWTWNAGLDNFYRHLSLAISSLKLDFAQDKMEIKNIGASGIAEVPSIISDLKLDYDNKVIIVGIISEFTPLLNISLLFPDWAPFSVGQFFTKYVNLPVLPVSQLSLPLRLGNFERVGLAALYHKDSISVYDKCLPLFYRCDNIELPKNITGKKVRIVGKIMSIDKRWGTLYSSNQISPFKKGSLDNYIGLLIEEIQVESSRTKFLTDLWRLDYCRINDYDEECLEFYSVNQDSDWPNIPNILNSYVSALQFESGRFKQVPAFAIVPKINLLNSKETRRAIDFLSNFYTRTFKKSSSAKTPILINKIGHGICKPALLKKTDCIFQYDQVRRSLKQKYRYTRRHVFD